MAPIKRKAAAEERPSKRSKPEDASAPSKKKEASTVPVKLDKNGKKQPQPRNGDGPNKEPVEKSILQAEERSFPRGGASVLTPLEHKQIKIQAERDVLFEQSGKGVKADYSDDDDDAGAGGADSAAPAKKRRKTKGKKDSKTDAGLPKIKISGLSYKNLVAGSLVLGQVTAVTSRDVALALPNNLTGFVPITAISEKINQKIEAVLAAADDDDEDKEDNEESDDDDDLDIKSLFQVGQYLRATVIATADDSSKKTKKRIELSVDPKQNNIGIGSSDIPMYTMIQAAVRSVEDHGLIMDLGLEDDSVNGFVSKKELGKSWDISKMREGQVLLCAVTGNASNGKVIKLSPDATRMADCNKQYVSDAPTIDAFLPGTAVEVLVTETSRGGVAGKIMGMLDATADIVHSGAGGRVDDITQKYKLGSKVKARIICNFPSSEDKKVGVSFLDHIKALKVLSPAKEKHSSKLQPSAIVEEAKVVKVEPAMGLFLKLGLSDIPAFAHISRISEKKIDTLSETTGQYKVDSTHKARILSFNPVDGVFNVSLEEKVIAQPFLRLEDVRIGQSVKGTVDKLLLGAKGVTGVLVKLADGIDGLVPEQHMSDVRLQHPEKKFREGFPVNARVLTVDLERRQIRLTLKKTLVNSDAKIWSSYADINIGDEAPGSIINIKNNGAVVQFYGDVRAWLPVSEMSEAYISDPTQHFRLGQTVNVHALSVDPEERELKVSCRDATAFGKDEESAWKDIKEGQLISATITEMGENVMLDLEGSNIKATLRLHHLSDGSESKCRSALKQFRVGQKLQDLVVLEKLDRRHIVVLSNKPSLVKAAKAGTLVSKFKDLWAGQEVSGFVRNITPDGIFVEFAGAMVGYLPKTQITHDKLALPAFGLKKDQSISARVLTVDAQAQRFALTLREQEKKEESKSSIASTAVVNSVDGTSSAISDYTLGKSTKARVISVKDTQLNVQLADNLQGRIDVSEAFNSFDEIKDRKRPLQKFKPKQIIDVKVLGVHDARNHRFLPITHRSSKVPVFELTAKTQELKSEADVLTLDKVQVGSQWLAYVNNIGDNHIWANISPNVRGRIDVFDLSDDASLLQDIPKNFPVGSALRVRVKSVDVSTNRLDLTARSEDAAGPAALSDLTVGQMLPGKIVKVTERSLTVQLSDTVSGTVTLTELTDDYTTANPTQHTKNEIVRAAVVAIDQPNKRVFLSLRPSKVLSSTAPVEDRQITAISQLNPNDIVRGFVKAVTDKGVIVNLGPRVDAFVRVSDISDSYVKDWKSAVEIDQLVKGRIIAADAPLNHVQMSLKKSQIDPNYKAPTSFGDLKVGDIITGRVRKVEDFGVFIDVDDTAPKVSGLCHKSQIADNKVDNVKKLYDEGDLVKAKVLNVDPEKRRISFGLKASYFQDLEDSDEDMDDADSDEDEEMDGVALGGEEVSDEEGGIEVDLSNVQDMPTDEDAGSSADDSGDESDEADAPRKSLLGGLTTGAFDWSGASALNKDADAAASDNEAEAPTKKRKRKAQIVEDRTGDLDVNGPQSSSDFERLLLTSPSDSALWIQYMAFQLQLSEVDAARQIGQRALRTIHMREQDEKLNVWIALLNLEVAYGDESKVEETFKQACQVQDSFTVHERLASIYTQAGKLSDAEKVFDQMVRKKEFRANPSMWLNYATFLFNEQNKPALGRGLLSRALQSIPATEHRSLTAKFAALEFKTANGDPERGRTVFEGMLAEWPKWTQGWDTWVDLERARVKEGKGEIQQVRGLYERMTQLKMKKRRARFVFKKWLDFEEGLGEKGQKERVTGLAKEYVEKMQEVGEDDEGAEE